jgi:hypothetical protein
LRKLNTEPSIGASHHVSVHLAKQFQRRIKDWSFSSDPLKNIAAIGILVSDWMISKKIFSSETAFPNELKFLLMDRDEINTLYRGLSIDASYEDSAHLAKRFQRRCF